MQRDNPRKARHTTDKSRKIVITTNNRYLNWQLYIKLLNHLRLQLDLLNSNRYPSLVRVISSSKPGTSVSLGS